MSVRSRRSLLAVVIVAWSAWLTAAIADLVTDAGDWIAVVNEGAIASAVTMTLWLAIATAVVPALVALRALVAADAHRCPRCAVNSQRIRVLPIKDTVSNS